MQIKTIASPACAIIALLCSACEPLYGPDYQGQPLAQFSGQVASTLALDDEVFVAISWVKLNEQSEGNFNNSPIAERADIEGLFPAAFTMNLYTPPPEDVVIDDFAGLSLGIITAVRASTPTVPSETDLLGVNEDFLVVYIPRLEALEGLELQTLNAQQGYNLYQKEGIELEGYQQCAAERDAQIEADCNACLCPDETQECEACLTCDRAANIAFGCHLRFKQHFVGQDVPVDLLLDPERARESPAWRDLFGMQPGDDNTEEGEGN